jgi:hypothetical protein
VLREIGVVEFHPSQWERFTSGQLWQDWAKSFPDIFDEMDVQIARNQAPPPMRYHFFEWLAAVVLYQTTGYLSLVEQYEFPSHQRKRTILQRVVPPDLLEFITDHSIPYGHVQCPDLLVYSPDFSDWFFCEVKGPRDTLSQPQRQFFHALAERSGKQIAILRFKVPPRCTVAPRLTTG